MGANPPPEEFRATDGGLHPPYGTDSRKGPCKGTDWSVKLFLGTFLAGALIAISAEASADNKVCYWNAEGLPYSKAPPPDADEALFPGGPMQAILAIIYASPQLISKQACGPIEGAHLVKSREIYRRWGCPPDSSMGQMVEGLASGGVFIWQGMSFLEYAANKYEEEFAEQCPLFEGIDPICYLVSGSSPHPKDMERYPQCAGTWPRIKAIEEFFTEILKRDKTVRIELFEKDRALIEAAGVD